MRMRGLGGAAALLVLGLSVSARAADDGAAPAAADRTTHSDRAGGGRMKRYTWLLLLPVLMGQGCLGMEQLFYEREVVEIKQPEPQPEPQPKPITEDDVTEANASQMAAKLQVE